MATDWKIDTDIYDIVSSIQNVEKRYIDDEDETTLSLGIFGFVTDTEAKKIQTATIMAGQLGNEMFPTRATLTKNVLTHAAYHNITDFNATPAAITTTVCVKVKDIETYINTDNEFYLDSKYPIYIGDYEFHFDYDIKIKRKKLASGNVSYSAEYILTKDGVSIINRLSNINNPYLPQPFLINIGNEPYIGIQCTIRQVTIEEIEDSMTSDSIIENKSYTFDFENQMADFIIEVTDGDTTTQVTPYMYGSMIDSDDEIYCWYLYTGTNSIRITFDSKSYTPGLNSQIYIKSFTTLGSAGNFEYLNIDQTSEGLYASIDSETYGYKNLIVYVVAVTDSSGGTDKKSKAELQKLIPKAAMARGSITTETDLSNYFDLINTDVNRLVMQKKVDNQLTRVWYGYFLLKDDLTNIIPTNTMTIQLDTSSGFLKESSDGRWILPSGSCIRLDPSTMVAEVIDASDIPDIYTDYYFNSGYYYYCTLYSILIDDDPLYSSYYLTACNTTSYFLYTFVNENSDIQFIANRFNFIRNIITNPDQYVFSFSIAKSINDADFKGITTERVTFVDGTGTSTTKVINTQNIRIILILYRDNVAYRWMECTLVDNDETNGIYSFSATIVTDNEYDDFNRIKIKGMNKAGSTTSTYGYVDETCEAKIYIMANETIDATEDDSRMGIDDIAPGYESYTVTNIYDCISGLTFFKNYTNVINTKITQDSSASNLFKITGIPCIGAHYLQSDTEAKYVMEAVNERKAYIDYCLELVENAMNIDFKFFNTYGPSVTYMLEDEVTSIGHIDVSLRFKVSLKNTADSSIIDSIKSAIKASIEDLYDIGSWHAPNLITTIENAFNDRINFIEFVGFNTYDADDQHMILVEPEDPNIVPEFINVRNVYDEETTELVPDIEIELV